MKANRKGILPDGEAVSPVIAVILMVAITVVLAGAVFALVTDIGQETGATGANVSFDASESGDNLTVITADGADWRFLQVRSNVAGIQFRVNNPTPCTVAADDDPCGNMTAAETWYDISAAPDRVEPSDYIHLCRHTSITADNVRIGVQNKEAKSLLGTFDFVSVGTNC